MSTSGRISIMDRVWLRLLLPCLLVLAIVFTAAISGYSATNELMLASIFSRNELLLRQSISVLTAQLDTIDKLSYVLAHSSVTQRLLLMGDSPSDNIDLLVEARDDIYSSTRNNDFILTYGIYLNDSKVLISERFALCSGLKYFYGTRFTLDDMSQGEFEELLLGEYQNGVLHSPRMLTIDDTVCSTMLYVQSLPYADMLTWTGALFFCLDMTVFDDLMAPIISGSDSSVRVYAPDGTALYSLGTREFGDIDIAGLQGPSGYVKLGENLVTYVHDDTHGWTYAAAVPLSEAASAALAAQTGYVWLMTIAACICLLLSLVIAYCTGRPLERLLANINQNLGGTGRGWSAFSEVDRQLSELLTYNQQIQSTLEQQSELVKTAFLHRLVHDEFESDSQLLQFMHYGGIQRTGDRFVMVAARLHASTGSAQCEVDANQLTSLMMEMLPSINLDGPAIFQAEPQLTLALVPWQHARGDIDAVINSALDALHLALEQSGIACDLARSSAHCELVEIVSMYREARAALSEAPRAGQGYSVYKGPMTADVMLTDRHEAALTSALRAGDSDTATALLIDMLRHSEAAASDDRLMLLNDLRRLFIRLGDSLAGQSSDVAAITQRLLMLRLNDERALRDTLLDSARALSQCFERLGAGRKGTLLTQLITFMEHNYASPTLSLSVLASHFNLSEVYISQFIKEQTGENFTTRLERMRIERACELLKRGSCANIEELAQRVGYNSSDTFRKAFKRSQGVSPSRWRSAPVEPDDSDDS